MASFFSMDFKTKRTLSIMALFVFLLSSFFVLAHHNYFLLGDLHNPNNDDVKYLHSARVLLNEGTLAYNSGNEPSAFIMPGISIILAGFMAVFGEGDGAIIAFRLFQCMLQAISIFLIFFIARYTFNTRTAYIVCGISMFYMPDYFSSGVVLSETMFRTALLLLVCIIIVAVESGKTSWYIWIGIIVAFLAYFKPHATLYPAILLILWWKHKVSWRDMVRYTFIIAGTYMVLLAPWWIRNMITFDRFILFTNSAGSPFLLGTRINYQLPPAGFFDAYPQYDPKTIFAGSDGSAVSKGLDILKYGFVYDTWNYVHWYTIGKLHNLYNIPYYWRPIWPISRSFMNVTQVILMSISVIGMMWAFIRVPFTRMLPVLLTFAYFTAIYMPFVAFSRYGYPNVIFLLMFAAFFVDRLLAVVRNK
ncbi:glycosyltransferase family 39 protein [Paenibacillus arenosi]|uniref:Glycosyltransferase family 39 protein n=1 Tax=Paenibacillus arenosi TaxID=2774142 RepID=A0ABR9ATG6_9BACL|nr:glycosyltransferase family 39 protein [Paenibacillus arenosi]MBD8497186.1 glycosyltransferase family 39 protein [Paenibacillus arenosi]